MTAFLDQLRAFFYDPDEDTEDLLALSSPANAPEPAREAPPIEHLAFRLDSERYASPISELKEIVKVPPLIELPLPPRDVIGLMNLRGEMLAVYDPKVTFRLRDAARPAAGPKDEQEPVPRSARILVVRSDRALFGVLVDEVEGVVRLRLSDLEEPPRGLLADEQRQLSLGRLEGSLYIVVGLARIGR